MTDVFLLSQMHESCVRSERPGDFLVLVFYFFFI